MPIYDQTFRRYDGPRNTSNLWWPVAWQTFRRVIKSKLAWVLVSAVVIPVIVFSIGFFGAAQIREMMGDKEKAELAIKEASRRRIPIFSDSTSPGTVLTLFLLPEFGFLWLVILTTGSAAVSLEKKHNALPLYFSRPLRPWSYIIGKIVGLAAFPAAVLAVAVILLYVQRIAYFNPASELWKQLPALLGALAYVGVISIVTSLVMIAFSAATTRPATAAICYFGFWFATAASTEFIQDVFKTPAAGAYSLHKSLQVLAIETLNVDRALVRLQRRVGAFELELAVLSIAVYSVFFLWMIRRNLRVVEVVK